VVALGDRRWGDGQERFRALAGREIASFRGRVREVTGDRVMATFDGPARAIRCARAIADAAQDLGLATRGGLHTGECELRDERVSGVAIALAGWVASQAAADEILVTSTVKDLVAGAELRFADRGARRLSGVPGEWRLFAVLPEGVTDAGTTAGAEPAPSLSPPVELSRRERDVLPLVALGLSNRQIADALNIGERTAESHVASILAKWGLSSRAQIAAATIDGNDRTDASSRR
jgi:DNA-binding CsgD family transcriptional regulator